MMKTIMIVKLRKLGFVQIFHNTQSILLPQSRPENITGHRYEGKQKNDLLTTSFCEVKVISFASIAFVRFFFFYTKLAVTLSCDTVA